MRRLFSRRVLGPTAILAGCALLAITTLVAFTSPARGSSTGIVYLTIRLVDSNNGQFPAGSSVTVTATLSNSSTTSVGDATPTVTVSYSTGVMSFVTNGAGWSCSTGTVGQGAEMCTDGTITAGGGTAFPLVFSVSGGPGDPASVTATVTDGQAINSASFSSLDTATDNATVAAPASYTNGVPPESFPRKVGGDQIISGATQNYTFTDGGTHIILRVPAAALPVGTHLGVYQANSAFWSSRASSSSASFVDGYGVAWTASGQSTGTTASLPVTLTVSDARASAGDQVHRAASSGIGQQAGGAGSGAWSASFTDDPGFILLRPSSTTTQTSSTTTNASGTTTQTSSSTTSSAGGGPRVGPDLVVSSLHVSPASKGKLPVQARTKNVGNRPAGRSTTAFYLVQVKGHHAARKVASRAVGALAPGKSVLTRLKISVPRSLAAGSYGVMACADAGRKVKELWETNNCRISSSIITVHRKGSLGAFTVTAAPPSAPRYMLVASPFGGSARKTAQILLLLCGVMLLVTGTVLVGLRHRGVPALA